jgi:putative DNA primase/helicase
MTTLLLDDLRHLIVGDRNRSYVETICPLCSHLRKPRNRQKRVCTIFFRDGVPISFNCHHCGEHGPIIDRNAARRHRRVTPYLVAAQPVHHGSNETAQARTEHAMRIFADAVPITGTPAAQYLAWRGFHLEAFPDDLRFHPACPFGQDRLPCMVAQVRDIRTNEPIAIHRTAIKPDGNGKCFDDGPESRKALGPISGGAIKLTPDDAITLGLGIAEGIETALRCMTLGWPMWSCLSASGIAKCPVLAGIEALTIFCDHDKSEAGQLAAFECRSRWVAAGVEVKVLRPPQVDTDWDDLLRAG